MRILLTNVQLNGRTGTEIVVRDLEAGLRRRGHDVCVYTPAPGVMADEIRARGGTVVSDLAAVGFEPEVIHGHHHVETAEALVRFPTAAAVFVCHDRTSWTDLPPVSPRIGRYVAVDLNCDERLAVEAGIPAGERVVIHNAVDLGRFTRRGPLPPQPRSAAVFSNNALPRGYADQIRAACAARGISVDVFGSGVGATLEEPESVLGRYDIVFAKARSALEALVAGCAVVVADVAGLGPLVTMDRVAELRDWNFGARGLQSQVIPELVEAQLDRYDPGDASEVGDWVRDVAGVERAVDAYLETYRIAVERVPVGSPPTTWEELHRSLLQHAGMLEGHLRDRGDLVARVVPPTVGPAVTVRLLRAPIQVNPGEEVTATAEVGNLSTETLVSRGTHPIALSYRWEDCSGAPLAGEPERTPLTTAVGPGDSHLQTMRLRVPDAVGRYRVWPDLVQEGRFWFSQLDGFSPHPCDVVVTAADLVGAWTLGRAAELVPLEVVRDGTFTELGFAGASRGPMLTFGESARFVERAVRNAATSCLIVPAELVDAVPAGVGVAVSPTPRVAFAQLHDVLATRTEFYGRIEPTRIHPSARVHPTAHVDPLGVDIGARAVVGPHASLCGPVRVAEGADIGAGARLGSAGFQTLDVDGSPREMVHAGGIDIGEGAVVFAGAIVARGLFRAPTVVGAGARIGNGAFVSHNGVVGPRSFVGHGAVVNGNVTIGADAWIGPGATITNDVVLGDGCRVSLGATVFGDVAAGEHLTGPAAVDHRIALRAAAELRRRR